MTKGTREHVGRGGYLELIDDLMLLAVGLQLLLTRVQVVTVLCLLDRVLKTGVHSHSAADSLTSTVYHWYGQLQDKSNNGRNRNNSFCKRAYIVDLHCIYPTLFTITS